MALYIFVLKLVVMTVRGLFAITYFMQGHSKHKPEWQKAWGQWAKEYAIRSSIGSPEIRASEL